MAYKSNSQRIKEIREKMGNNGYYASNAQTTNSNYQRAKNAMAKALIKLDTLEQDLKTVGAQVQSIYSGWQPQETMQNAKSAVVNLQTRLKAYQNYSGGNGTDISDIVKAYDSVIADWDNIAKVYGSFQNAEAYNAKKEEWKLDEKFKGLSYDDVQTELKKYSPDSDEYKYLSAYKKYTNLNDFNKAVENADKSESYRLNEMLTKLKNERKELSKKLPSGASYTRGDYTPITNRIKELDEQISEIQNQYDTSYSVVIEKERNKYKLDNKADLYNYLENAENFENDSAYNPEFFDENDIATHEYEFINNPEKYEGANWFNSERNYGLHLLNDKEKKYYNFLYKEDKENGTNKANEFLADIETNLEKRIYDTKSAERKETILGEDSNAFKTIGMNALSIPATLAGGVVGGVDTLLDLAGGKEYNPYGRGKALTNYASDVRYYTDEAINSDVVSFLYNTGMSMADSFAGAYTLGVGNAVVMGSNAFQQTAKEMTEQGENEDTIFKTALASGLAEVAFEYIDISNLLKVKSTDGWKKIFTNGLKQAGVEGASELATEISNILSDEIIRGENSELSQMRKDLKERGFTEQEIKTKLAKNVGARLGQAFLGGAVSGGVMGGFQSGREYSAMKNVGQEIRANEQVGKMLETASLTPQESEAYKAYAKYAKKGINADNITDAQLGALRTTTENEALDTLGARDNRVKAVAKNLLKLGATDEQKHQAIKTLQGLKKVDTEHTVAKRAKELNKGNKTETSKVAETGDAIGKIASIKIGKDDTVITTADGKELSSDSVELSQKDSDIVSYAEKLGEEKGNLFLCVYDGQKNVEAVKDSFELVTELAKHKFSQDYILKHKGTLTTEQVKSIYANTVISQYQARENAIKKLNEKWGKSFSVQGKIDDSIVDYDNTGATDKVQWRSLRESQRKAITFAIGFAKATGMNLTLVKGGFDGAYSAKGNTIYLNVYAGLDKIQNAKSFTDTIITTVSHETTHWAKEKASQLYREIDELVFSVLKKSGEDEADLIAEELKRLRKEHPEQKYTEEDARDEIIARACEDMLSMSEEGKKLFNSLSESEQQSLVEKIKDIIKKLNDWVTDILSQYKSDSDEAKIMREYQKELHRLSKKWDAMLKQAIETNQSLQKEGITGEALRGAVEGVNARNNTQFATRYDQNGNPIVWVTDNILLQNKGQPEHQFIANFIAGHIGDAYTIIESGQSVYLGDDLPNEYTQSKYTQSILKKSPAVLKVKNKVSADIGSMIEIATNRKWEKTEHQTNKDAKYGIYKYETKFGVPIQDSKRNTIGANVYKATLVIRNASNGKKYLYDIVSIKKDIATSDWLSQRITSTTAKNAVAQKDNAFNNRITQPTQNVKGKMQFSGRESDNLKNSEGRELSQGQQEYFKNSKVLAETVKYTNDKNDKAYNEALAKGDIQTLERMVQAKAKAVGYSIEAYHGTDADFTVYDESKIKNSYGFWFSADKNYAKSHGKTLQHVFLKFDNIIDIDSIEDSDLLWGMVRKYYKTDNITESHIFNKEFGEYLSKQGYDGISWDHDGKKTYLVFSPEQIKSAEPITYDDNGNVIPLSQRFDDSNKDIRYARRSNSTVYDVLDETERVEKEYQELKEDFERLQEKIKLDKTITNGTMFNENQLNKVAGHIRKISQSAIDKADLVEQLQRFYQYIAKDKELNWFDVYSKAYEIAERVLKEAKEPTTINQEVKAVLDELRGTRIYLSDVQKSEMKSRYDKDWHNRLKGKFTLVNDKNSDLDSKWQEWAHKYPSLFDESVTEGDQPIRLLEIYDSLRESLVVYEEYDVEERTRWIADEIYDGFWEVSPLVTTADKHNKQIAQLKAQHSNAMADLRKAYNERLYERVGNQKLADTMHYGGKIAKLTREYDEKIDELKSKHRTAVNTMKDAKNKAVEEKALADSMHYEKEIAKLRRQRDERVEKERFDKQVELVNKLRKQRDERERQAKEHGKELLQQYKENAQRKRIIRNISAKASDLRKALLKNSKDYHIHEALKPAVIQLLESIDFSSAQLLGLRGGEKKGTPTKNDKIFVKSLEDIKNVVDTGVAKDELIDFYGLDVAEQIDSVVTTIREVFNNIEGDTFVLQEMTVEELENLNSLVAIIKNTAKKVNEFLAVENTKKISELAREQIEYAHKIGETKTYIDNSLPDKLRKGIVWKQKLPYYAFSTYGEAGQKIFKAFQDGWDKFAFNINKILKTTDEIYEKYKVDVKTWNDDVKTFDINGKELRLTVAQIMSLYCLEKREYAKKHILRGGIRATSIDKKGKDIANQSAINVSEKDINKIISTLTNEQKATADSLQRFMSKDCADWGNYVTMKRWGIKSFTEEFYFPINVDNRNVGEAKPEEHKNSMYDLLNKSFTKPLTKEAQNSIMIDNIFDVFAQHTTDMAKYNALALPILDTIRWYNYKEKNQTGTTEESVQMSLEKAFGKEASTYITTFLKDINGEKTVSRDIFGSGFLTKFKVASVGANIRVIALQPTSYFRAGVVMDDKYLTKAVLHKPKFNKAKEWCGMALWKSLGYFDTNVQKGVASLIKKDNSRIDKLVDWSMKGAQKADEITLGYLWNACELEVRDKRKDLRVGSDEFYQAISERLREVIYATQVVDSVLTRSEMMRSSDSLDKVFTAFMSEPTLSYNILLNTATKVSLDARELGNKKKAVIKNGKLIYKTIVSYITTNLVTALVETLFDWERKEEETTLEDVAKMFGSSLLDNLNPLMKIPYIEDIISVFKGYPTSLPNMQGFESGYRTFSSLIKNFKGEGNVYTTLKNGIKTASYVSGLPFYNAYRETMSAMNKLDILTSKELEEMFKLD